MNTELVFQFFKISLIYIKRYMKYTNCAWKRFANHHLSFRLSTKLYSNKPPYYTPKWERNKTILYCHLLTAQSLYPFRNVVTVRRYSVQPTFTNRVFIFIFQKIKVFIRVNSQTILYFYRLKSISQQEYILWT